MTAIAPVFVIIYFKKPIVGIYTILTAIILSLFVAIAPTLIWGIPPYLRIWELDSVIFSNSRSLAYYHTFPTVYLISFLVGFPFGFMLMKRIQFSRLQETLFWTASLVAIPSVYFWHNTFWRLDHSAPLISALLWHTIGKLAFSLGFGWIFYACCTGRAGIEIEIDLGQLNLILFKFMKRIFQQNIILEWVSTDSPPLIRYLFIA